MSEPEDVRHKGKTVRRQFEWAETRPSAAVIQTVAEAVDRSPTSFGPLFEYVDPDALDALFRSDERVLTDEYTVVSFLFASHDVTVRSDGTVEVRTHARDAS
jgi:hypothetical protein